MMEKRVELLAPCGGYESFLAAVNAGADAVYLGGREFGARAYAENFLEEELVSVIRQAHLFGVKVYLTVNTLVKEREFSKIYDYMLPLYQAGLDGAIVQDMGVFSCLKRNFPDLKLHASTQMSITGAYGAAYLKEAGCERIVPARELSLQEIRAIKEEVSVEIEAFIHGAMCYCYSGLCLMSSMIGGRSGNRGRCAQPCRLPYKTAGKEGYFLSLKDMNTLEHIPELIEAGIDSFKIEGRMKRPEYVAGVVSVYRKYIDKYYEGNTAESGINGDRDTGKWSRGISQEDRRMLSDLYIRSETGSGYYFKSRGREMLTLRKPGYNEAGRELLDRLRETYVRELPGKALDIYVRCRAGEPLYGEARFAKGEEEACLSALGPVAEKSDRRPSDAEEIRAQLVKTGGTPFVVRKCEVELGENTFVPMKWVKQLRRGLVQKVYEEYGAGRRPAAGHDEHVDEDQNNAGAGSEIAKIPEEGYSLAVMVQSREQFEGAASFLEKAKVQNAGERRAQGIREILIVDADLLLEDKEARERLYAGKISWGIKCPAILRRSDEAFLKKLRAAIEEGKPQKVYCGTMDMLAWVKSISFQGQIAGEASLYAWNREAVLFWERELDYISIPLELDSREIRELCISLQKSGEARHGGAGGPAKAAGLEGEKVRPGVPEALVYGRTPFMASANCIKLSSGQCDKNRGRYAQLADRMGNKFPVYTNCAHCYNIIYNYLPASCHENLWMLLQDGIRAFRIEFTTEDRAVTEEVTQTFHGLLASELEEKGSKTRTAEKGKLAGMETTQGRFRRPVE